MRYIETQKFSDVYVSCKTLMPFNKQNITALNVLIYMMKAKTEDMDSKKKLASCLNRAYGTKVFYGLTTYGDLINVDIRFRFIRTDWIENKDYTMNLIYIMDQVLFHTVLDEDNFNEAVYLLKNRLLAIQDDPSSLSCLKAFEMTNPKHSISIPVQGSLDDLKSLTLKDVVYVYSLYMDLAKHFYVCGLLNDTLYDYLNGLDFHSSLVNQRTMLTVDEMSYRVWSKNIAQTCISQVYTTSVDIESEDYYPLCVMNSILGQSQKSLLFDEIREKNSLCYSIYSSLIRFDGALLIHTGTQKENVDKVNSLIEKQIHRLSNMDYDDEYLEVSKKGFKDSIMQGLDQPSSLIAQTFLDDLLHRNLSAEERIEKMMSVTKEDIARVASRLNLASCAIIKEA